MATHSSVLAWRIPGTEEPGGLPSMGSHRVRHDWSDLAQHSTAILRNEGKLDEWKLAPEMKKLTLKIKLPARVFLFVYSELESPTLLKITLSHLQLTSIQCRGLRCPTHPPPSGKSEYCYICLKNKGTDKWLTQGQETEVVWTGLGFQPQILVPHFVISNHNSNSHCSRINCTSFLLPVLLRYN